MQHRYKVEDLLKLRESPLVAKPSGLPPKEEWMGSVETRSRVPASKTRTDDVFAPSEAFQKRPALGDAAKRSTTDPDRIHLGPPRHSFNSSKARDDRDGKQTDRKGNAFGGPLGRFGERSTGDDTEDSGPRPRRTFKDSALEEGGPPIRSNRNTSSKLDQPWTRKDRSADFDHDAKDSNPPWRRGVQRDKDFDKQEAEPEWADADDTADTGKVHTQADFAAWMAKMKNKPDLSQPQEDPEPLHPEMIEKPVSRVEADSASVDRFFAKYEDKQNAAAVQTTAKPTKSRFAGIFTKTTVGELPSQGQPQPQPQPPAPAPAPAQSHAQAQNQMSWPPPTVVAQPPSYPTPAQEMKEVVGDQDKAAKEAAFQKLVTMLKSNQDQVTENSERPHKMPTPMTMVELAATRSPHLASAISTLPQSNRTPGPIHTPNLSLDRLIESRSPANKARPEQDRQSSMGAQDLLNLLKKQDLNDNGPMYTGRSEPRTNVPQPPPGLSRPAGMEYPRQPGPPNRARNDGVRSIFDDPAFLGYKTEHEYQPAPAIANNNPLKMADQGGLSSLFASMNDQSYAMNARRDRGPNPYSVIGEPRTQPTSKPPGLESPHGVGPMRDTRPPPGWQSNANINVQQPQPQRPIPNFANANQYSYPSMPPPPPQQQQQQQQPPPQQTQQQQQQQHARYMPHRKPTNEFAGQPGYMNVPPGFGPTPQYSPPQLNLKELLRGEGVYTMNDRRQEQQEMKRHAQQQQANVFANMYGTSQRGSGNVQAPPGFR